MTKKPKPPAGKPAPAKPAPAKPGTKPAAKPESAAQPTYHEYLVGDEISFASPQGMIYGTVVKIIKDPSSPAIEIEFEDGRKEVKKTRDRALRLLRRASGKSEL